MSPSYMTTAPMPASSGTITYRHHEEIPDEKQHPAALLELLGACVSSGGGPGTLTTREASVVCKSAVAMLLPEENALADGGADAPQGGKTETGGEGRDPHGKGAETEDDVALALKPFPLDVDQEVIRGLTFG